MELTLSGSLEFLRAPSVAAFPLSELRDRPVVFSDSSIMGDRATGGPAVGLLATIQSRYVTTYLEFR